MTVVFSAVLNNVTAMIIVGSLTGVSLRQLGIANKLLGFLLIEGLLTNVGGLLTLVSSVPNIIIGSAAGITFMTFFLKSAPYVIVATVATIWLGKRMFKVASFASEQERSDAAERGESVDENEREPVLQCRGDSFAKTSGSLEVGVEVLLLDDGC